MPFLIPGGGGGGYRIARSLRFDPASNTYLNRTPSSSGNRDLMTMFFMCKRCGTGVQHVIFEAAVDVNNRSLIVFGSTDVFQINMAIGGTTVLSRISAAVFRDPSAWYAFTVQIGTVGNIYRAWVWDQELTWTTTTNPASGTDTYFNHTVAHYIGRRFDGTSDFDGYMTHFHLIDGLALDYTAFLTQDATGVWGPKRYTGAYGTNGFKLDFADNSAVTAATLGKDTSGNGNNWTPNAFSVTAGIGNDSLVDTPTNYGGDSGAGGEVRGNYCTLNPLDKNTRLTISNGGLLLVGDGNNIHQLARGTFAMTAGKWYWEVTGTGIGSGAASTPVDVIGIADDGSVSDGVYVGSAGNSAGRGYGTVNSGVFTNGAFAQSGPTAALENAAMGFAYDAATGSMWFRNSAGSWIQGNPVTATSPSITCSTPGLPVRPAASLFSSAAGSLEFNFGQRSFAHAAPAGFKALCTQNLPVPVPTPALPATFTGNAAANGPFVWAKGVVQTVTINGNVATRGTHFDGLSNGIKLRTASASYNTAGSNTVTAATYGAAFKYARGQGNP